MRAKADGGRRPKRLFGFENMSMTHFDCEDVFTQSWAQVVPEDVVDVLTNKIGLCGDNLST